ncbi:hypothetical protein BJF79_03360 [Actinomadura sp. CNU-125]|uniref:hypothetical protein n=1 Tax=Actinomadura sp. CNU-125 TaxID=1904961 RepID=UPI00095A9D5E|nr:hypothetical protein [Actinomadura sp. CNU-125]OLT12951.1 hypothetical protein BJF79_03360 [Actinomadura sp. CNU-125]
MAEEGVTTIRTLVNMLTLMSSALPDGLETRVEFGICDGENLQMVDKVDLSDYTTVTEDGREEETVVAFRGHAHPGQSPGRLLQGVTADADEQMHRLVEDD